VRHAAASITAVGSIVAYSNVRFPRPLGYHDSVVSATASGTLNGPELYASSSNDLVVNFFGYVLPITDSAPAPNPSGMNQRAAAFNGVQHLGISDGPAVGSGWTNGTTATIPNSATGTSVSTGVVLAWSGDTQPAAGDAALASSPPAPPTQGNIYYVDSSASGYNGTAAPTSTCATNDAGPGTSAQPFCTLAHVNSLTLHSGDQVLLKAGDTWRENLDPVNSGSPNSRIVFGAYGSGAKPIISGADVISTWTQCNSTTCGSGSSSIWYKDVSYSFVEGIYITSAETCPGAGCPASSNDPGWGLARAADLPSGTGTSPGPAVNPSSHGGLCARGSALLSKMVAGTWLFDPTGTSGAPSDVTLGRLYVWTGDSSDPNSSTVEAAVRDPIIGKNVFSALNESYLTFMNLHLTNGGEPLRFGRTFQDGGPANNPNNDRYITVMYSTADHLGTGQFDDDCYAGGSVDVREGSNALIRHITTSYIGGHGNNPRYHAVVFGIVEDSDLSNDDYDAPDTKSCDECIIRYNLSHDSILPPSGYQNQVFNDGIYMESNFNNNLASWTGTDLTAMTSRPYASVGWQIYGNTVYNVTGATGGVYIHTWGMGAGQIFSNTVYGEGNTADYAIDNDNTKGNGNITDNLVHDLNGSNGIRTNGYSESFNFTGLTSAGAAITNFQTMSSTDIVGVNPLLQSPVTDFTLQAGSRAIAGGSLDVGYGGFNGAWPQHPTPAPTPTPIPSPTPTGPTPTPTQTPTPTPTPGAIALIQHTSGFSTSTTTQSVSYGSNVTAGDALILVQRMSTTSQDVTYTDTLGNAFSKVVTQAQTTDGHQLRITWAIANASGADSVTAHFWTDNTDTTPATNNFHWLGLIEVSNVNSVDVTTGNQGGSTGPATATMPTTTHASEFVVGGMGDASSYTGTITAGNSFTALDSNTSGSGSSPIGADAYRIVSATGVYSPSFTLSGAASNWSAIGATYYESVVGPTPTPTPTPTPAPANIVIIGTPTTSASASCTANITLNKPTGVASGDFLIAMGWVNAPSRTFTCPTGWTKPATLGGTIDGIDSAQLCTLVAGANEPTSYTLSYAGGGTNNCGGTLIAYRNTSGIDGTASSFTQGLGSGSTVSLTGVTASAGDTVYTELLEGGYLGTLTVPTGYTSEVSDSSVGAMNGADQSNVGAGATGSLSWSGGSSTRFGGWVLALAQNGAVSTPSPTPTATPTPTPTPNGPTPTPSPTPLAIPHFANLTPGATLPSDSTCQAEVDASPIGENAPWNQNDGTGYNSNNMQGRWITPSYFYNSFPNSNAFGSASFFSAVNGDYTFNQYRSTDMILRWAACKWGVDENWVRAETDQESTWHQDCNQMHGGSFCNEAGDCNNFDQCGSGTPTPPYCSGTADAPNISFNDGLKTYPVTDGSENFVGPNAFNGPHSTDGRTCSGVWDSWGIIQSKSRYAEWYTWPMIALSTSWGSDYRWAKFRACMNGWPRTAGSTDYTNAVSRARTSPNSPVSGTSGVAPSNLLSGETNLQYLAIGCIATHFCGGWYGTDGGGCNTYAQTFVNILNAHNWPGHIFN